MDLGYSGRRVLVVGASAGIGFATAQMLAQDTLSADQHDMVEHILAAGHSMLGILNEILDLSKIEAGQLQLERQAFKPRLVLQNIISVMAASSVTPGARPITSRMICRRERKRPSSPQIMASASPRRTAIEAMIVELVRTCVRAASGVMPLRPAISR